MIHKIDNVDFDINNLNNINDIDNINDLTFDKDVNMFLMMNSILFWYLGGGKMNNDKNKIWKLFYRMDMFYLIINKNPTFYLKRSALGGGASIYIYIIFCPTKRFGTIDWSWFAGSDLGPFHDDHP